MSQMKKVNCQYGAPMGRAAYGIPQDGEKYRLYHMKLDSGGYDDGGAYWGIGAPLYCAEDVEGDYRQFTRARTRREAAAKLGIIGHLVRGI